MCNQECCRCAFDIKLCITLPHLGVLKISESHSSRPFSADFRHVMVCYRTRTPQKIRHVMPLNFERSDSDQR